MNKFLVKNTNDWRPILRYHFSLVSGVVSSMLNDAWSVVNEGVKMKKTIMLAFLLLFSVVIVFAGWSNEVLAVELEHTGIVAKFGSVKYEGEMMSYVKFNDGTCYIIPYKYATTKGYVVWIYKIVKIDADGEYYLSFVLSHSPREEFDDENLIPDSE